MSPACRRAPRSRGRGCSPSPSIPRSASTRRPTSNVSPLNSPHSWPARPRPTAHQAPPAATASSSAATRRPQRKQEAVVSNPDRVVVEILVAAPIETVWKALREPVEIARWFGWNYPKLIEDIGWMFVDGVKADEATRTLWAEGRMDSFKLEAVGEQTIVRVIRSAPVTGADWRGIYEDSTEGWITFLQQLRFAME